MVIYLEPVPGPDAKDFNLRCVFHRLCKKFKKQNAPHVVSHLYLKMPAPYARHAPKIKVTLTDIADAAADTSGLILVAISIEIRTKLFLFCNQELSPIKTHSFV